MKPSRAFVAAVMVCLLGYIRARCRSAQHPTDQWRRVLGSRNLRCCALVLVAGDNVIIVSPRTDQSGKGAAVVDIGAMLNLFSPTENAAGE